MYNQYTRSDKNEVFKLRAKGLSYERIAKKLKMPAITVGVWVRDAVAAHPRKYSYLKFRAKK